MTTSKKKREIATGLPTGWIREEIVRQNGISRGKSDVYYVSPTGKRARSKPELIKLLGDECDLTHFDYRSGKMLNEKVKPKNKRVLDIRKNDYRKLPLKRKTLSIRKQPAAKKLKWKSIASPTLKATKTKMSIKARASVLQHTLKEKVSVPPPVEVDDVVDTVVDAIDLPRAIKAVTSGDHTVTPIELLHQIANQLQQVSAPVALNSSEVIKDPCVWLNTQQPICKSFLVTENDLKKQESRVLAARKRLEQALKQDADLQRNELMLLA